MSDIESVPVAFPEPIAARLRAAVASGEYQTTSDVIRDAVDLWSERQSLRDRDIAILRRAWDEGIASGDPEPLDMNALLEEARAKPTGSSG